MKAQLSIYGIIAVLLVVVLIFVFRPHIGVEETYTSSLSAEEVEISLRAMANSCLDFGLKDAVKKMGESGGRIKLDKRVGYYSDQGMNVHYAYKFGENALPTIEEMEDELQDYLNYYVPFCVAQKKQVPVTVEEAISEVEITKTDIKVQMNMPITFSAANTKGLIDGYSGKLQTRLGTYHDWAEELVKLSQEDPDYIDAVYFLNLPVKSDIYTPQNDVMIYRFQDDQYQVDYKPYLFFFALKFQ